MLQMMEESKKRDNYLCMRPTIGGYNYWAESILDLWDRGSSRGMIVAERGYESAPTSVTLTFLKAKAVDITAYMEK